VVESVPLINNLAIAILGAGVFVRIIAKEKNRRERHLLERLEERERQEQQAADEEQNRSEEGMDQPAILVPASQEGSEDRNAA